MKAVSIVCKILLKSHRNWILPDVINGSSSQRAPVMVWSSLLIHAAIFRKTKKWIDWAIDNLVVAAVLLVDTVNIIRHER